MLFNSIIFMKNDNFVNVLNKDKIIISFVNSAKNWHNMIKDLFSPIFSNRKIIFNNTPNENTNILITSFCDIKYENTKNTNKECIKILISGEPNNLSNVEGYDLLIDTKDEESMRPLNIPFVYIPFYAMAFYERKNHKENDLIINNKNKNNKTKFCAFMYNKCWSHRETFYDALSKYKKVDALGKCKQQVIDGKCKNVNTDRHVYNDNVTFYDIAVDKFKPYKFVLALENTSLNGYITEKIVNPMLSNSIPIYWGSDDVNIHFNSKSFININDFDSYDECVEYIKKVDNDDKLYNDILKEPWLINNKPNDYFLPNNNAITQLKHIFCPNEQKINIYHIACSYGEIIDKLSILKIKSLKVTDQKQKTNIINELNLLMEYKNTHHNDKDINDLYNKLFECNLRLWDIEDKIRIKSKNKQFGENYIQLAESVHIENDKRYQLKRQVNLLSNSFLVEEKIYEHLNDNSNINEKSKKKLKKKKKKKMRNNAIFRDIHVINLKRRPEKWNKLKNKFKDHDVNLVKYNAIDGNMLSQKYINEVNDKLGRKLRNGQIGCVLSHVNVWKKCVDNNMPYITVAEDDFMPKDNFSVGHIRKTIKMIDEQHPNWDILYLGKYNELANAYNIGLEYNLPSIAHLYNKKPCETELYKSTLPRVSMYLYIMSQRGCKKCIKSCNIPVAPLDVQMWYTETGLNSYILKDDIVYVDIEISDTSCDNVHLHLKEYLDNKPEIIKNHVRNPLNRIEKNKMRKIISAVSKSKPQVQELNKLAKKYNNWFQIYYNLAKSHLLLEEIEKARINYHKACQLNNDNYNINSEYARFLEYYYKKSKDQIIQQWLHCNNIDEGKVDPYIKVFEILLNEGYHPSFEYTIKFGERGIKYNPDSLALLNKIAILYENLNLLSKSLEYHMKCLEKYPNNKYVLYNVGLLIIKSQTPHDCVKYFNKCIKIDPKYLPVYITLCRFYSKHNMSDETLEIANRALKFSDNVNLYYQRGSAYLDLFEFDLARKDLEKVEKDLNSIQNISRPDKRLLGNTYNGIARLNKYERNFDVAEDYYEMLFYNVNQYFSDPKDIDKIVTCYAQFKLMQRDYKEGFEHYCYENKHKQIELSNKPRWDGQKDCTVICYNAGGLGDSFMYGRFIEFALERTNKFIFMIGKKIHHLFETSKYINDPKFILIKDADKVDYEFDYYIELANLPFALDITYDNVPNNKYMMIKNIKKTGITNLVKNVTENYFKVAINWHGNKKNNLDKQRSIPLEKLKKLFKIKGIVWISVQKDLSGEEKDILKKHNVINLSEIMDKGENSFTDTINIFEIVDLVISTDTSLVHLSAALNIKTWALLSYIPEWRWGLKEKSVWYPNMELFRQPHLLDWNSVVDNVQSELISLVNK